MDFNNLNNLYREKMGLTTPNARLDLSAYGAAKPLIKRLSPMFNKGLGYALDYRFLIPALTAYGIYKSYNEPNEENYYSNYYDATDDLYNIYKNNVVRNGLQFHED